MAWRRGRFVLYPQACCSFFREFLFPRWLSASPSLAPLVVKNRTLRVSKRLPKRSSRNPRATLMMGWERRTVPLHTVPLHTVPLHTVPLHTCRSTGAAPAAATPAAAMPEVAVTWTTPGEWKEMPNRSMMRAATYQAEGAAGAAEIAVFYFGPGQGGDVESNIARWVGQFQETASDAVARSTRDANGLKQYLVKVSEGTFSSGMPGGPAGPQKEWGMEAAIVETPSGSYFFKMTGPAKTVAQHSEAFHSMLKSIKTKG